MEKYEEIEKTITKSYRKEIWKKSYLNRHSCIKI